MDRVRGGGGGAGPEVVFGRALSEVLSRRRAGGAGESLGDWGGTGEDLGGWVRGGRGEALGEEYSSKYVEAGLFLPAPPLNMALRGVVGGRGGSGEPSQEVKAITGGEGR